MPAGERATVRINTGEQAQVGNPTGAAAARVPAGEQASARGPAGGRSPAPAAGEPPTVPVISGNRPAVSRNRAESLADPAGDDQDGPGEAPEGLETVDLSARMTKQPEAEDGDDPAADTTAVLEMRPTVDLSSRLEQEKAERRS